MSVERCYPVRSVAPCGADSHGRRQIPSSRSGLIFVAPLALSIIPVRTAQASSGSGASEREGVARDVTSRRRKGRMRVEIVSHR